MMGQSVQRADAGCRVFCGPKNVNYRVCILPCVYTVASRPVPKSLRTVSRR